MPEAFTLKHLPKMGPEALASRPEHAAAIGRIIAHWNWVEAELLKVRITDDAPDFYASAMELLNQGGPNRRLRFDDFLKEELKPALLDWAGEHGLRDLMRGFFDRFYEARSQRNMIAHGLWCSVPSLPQSLIVVDIGLYLRDFATEQARHSIGILARKYSGSAPDPSEDRESVLQDLADAPSRFELEDLLEVEDRILECLKLASALHQDVQFDVLGRYEHLKRAD